MVLAKSGDSSFIRKILQSNLSGFVHSTFNRTYNIQCLEDGELYTIACNELDNGPNTLVVDLPTFKNMDINVNDGVLATNGCLSIANKMFITVDQAQIWRGDLPTYPVNTNCLKNNVQIMRQYIEIHGKSGGIKSKGIYENSFEREMAKMIKERTDLLLNELLSERFRSAIPHAISLIGLGPGLTPSGDDFLVGLFITFHMKGSPLSPERWLCEEIEKAAKTATNDISYMAIKKASAGQVRESVVDLVAALLVENEENVFSALRKVLAIGSSSGTDIALGILYGLETNIKIGGTL